jgi:2-polyprenyl-3-methyl-5-hydroxy-6-metoxy-1,4-benzoquinol methylase
MQQYDAITLMDILHYLQAEQQKLLLNKCIRHLKPGGQIIIRDGDRELAKRHRGTRLTEIFSTGITGFNKTSGSGLSFLSGTMIRDVAACNNMQCRVIDETVYTSNVIFILKHSGGGQ